MTYKYINTSYALCLSDLNYSNIILDCVYGNTFSPLPDWVVGEGGWRRDGG